MILTSETPDAWRYIITRYIPGKDPEVLSCVKYYDSEGSLLIRMVEKDGKWIEVAESSKRCLVVKTGLCGRL